VGTSLKRDLGNTEGSLRNLIQLEYVNAYFDMGKLITDLGECSSEFNNLFQGVLCRFCHQWGVVP
jgi:hypothetical protein